MGNECFKKVSELKLIGMKMLERVLIGENCFTKKKGGKESYGLYVKNCELLRELKIGNHSFEEYSVCEIENVGSLEVIEVGDECFSNVNELKLKSDCSVLRVTNRLAQLENTSVWLSCILLVFSCCI